MNIEYKKTLIIYFIIFNILVTFPILSHSAERDLKALNTVNLSGRFNELESQDGYSYGVSYGRLLNSFKVGISIEKHTTVSGVWAGIDVMYQALESKVGYGAYYAHRLEENKDNVDYLTPKILYVSLNAYLQNRKKSLFLEFKPGFDLQYLKSPPEAILGRLTGFIIGSSISLGLRF